jgi:hypothetical protein
MANVSKADREIRKIAYALWMEEGQPEGRDREHWKAAKQIWNFRNREEEVEPADASAIGRTPHKIAPPHQS